jgi:hypothetical protein
MRAETLPLQQQHLIPVVLKIVSNYWQPACVGRELLVNLRRHGPVPLQNLPRVAMHSRRLVRNLATVIEHPPERLTVLFPTSHHLRHNFHCKDGLANAVRLGIEDNPKGILIHVRNSGQDAG